MTSDEPARPAPESGDQDAEPTVVGIGASAGGLAALKVLFRDIPPDSGLAFVVVVHLSPDRESHLATVLQPHVKMPVHQVTETVRLEPDHVYLIPPNANLDAIDTHLRLTQLEERRQERAPVDHFFRTLAATHNGNAVGVILTGSGSDGALGVKEIKEKGGLSIVQAPEDAEYDGMPQSAIATGVVDLVLPLADIAAAVLRITKTSPQVQVTDDESAFADDTRRLLHKAFAQIRARTGRDFTRYKRSTILRRVARRMQIQHVEELSQYLDLLRSEPDEVRALADDLLITVTNFFRGKEVFERLEKSVLPKIFARKPDRDSDVRVWSVGCATGEEAYSLAILLLEEAARHETPPRLQVFASDLHERSLERARQGFYPGDIETHVSPERLRRFFEREDVGYRIRKSVREIVVFTPHNLLSDPPFSRLDLISCRNLLIYLQRDAQEEVDELFHYALRPDGFLMVGASEAVVRSELFVPEDKKLCIYRKRDVPTPEPRLPVFPLWRKQHAQPDAASLEPDERKQSVGELHERLVERYAPPSLLIGPDDKVAHVSEHAGRFLVHPGGELTANVLRLVRPELRFDLRNALSAARSGQGMRTKPIRVQFDGGAGRVVLHVRPSMDAQDQGFVLVFFDEQDQQAEAADAERAPGEPAGVHQRELEAELALMRQRLQAVVEEHETGQEEMRASNEELQSANEELRSTLEKLETSKEELHSMNEELHTVNQENRHKVDELAQLSSDLQNLLAATDIATLFLDRDLRILRFTPRTRELFNVRNADRGRPLSDLTHRLGYSELSRDAARTLEHLAPVEREVQGDAGGWYQVRVLPYRSTSDRIEGVVMTFVDITQRKRAEEALRLSEEQLSEELATMTRLHELVGRLLVCPDLGTAMSQVLEATMAVTAAELGLVHLLEPSADLLSVAAHQALPPEALALLDRVPHGDRTPFGRAWAARQRVVVPDLAADPAWAGMPEAAAAAGVRGIQSTPLVSRGGAVLGILSTCSREPHAPSERDLRILDLTARQAADYIDLIRSAEALNEKARLLEEEDERKGFFLATLGHELRNPLAALDISLRLIEDGARDAAELHPLMAAEIRQLTHLVNDLLEVSHVTRGTLVLRRAPVDLVGIVRRVAEVLSGGLQARDQHLDAHLPDTLVVDGDEKRLEQVLHNLLSNASKFSPEGSRIEVGLRREGGTAVLAVRDQGCGLQPEELNWIFEPFTQASPGGGGLGIGLPLVKRLVQLHGGSVTAASEGAERGSVFTVRLPVGELRDAPGGAAEASGSPAGLRLPAGTRVLVVDDARDTADGLALHLQTHGAEVRCAYNGRDGLAAALEWQPAVALLDLGLPDVPGYEVARQIRAAPGGDRMLLLAVTGFGDPQAEQRVLEAGFDERLVKPVEPERLYLLIRQHVQRS